MNKRVVLAVVGVLAIVTVIWLARRGGESGAPAQTAFTNADAPVPVGSSAETSASPPAASEAPSAMRASATLPEAIASLPIDVSPGFEYLNTPLAEMKETDSNRPMVSQHQQLASEPRDESWAPRVEEALTAGIHDSLMAQGLDTQRVELHVVECRSSGCEIQAVGYREDNGRQGVDLQTILPRMMLESGLGDEFDREVQSMSMRMRPDGRIGFFVYLPRKKP